MPSDTRAAKRKSDTGQIAPGTVLGDGKYRVQSLLASGGMGHVYVAEQVALGRRVALKVLRLPDRDDGNNTVAEHFRKRFFREASILAKLQHVNVVTLYDYGRVEGEPERYFMAMEYLDGPTLAQRIEERGPVPVDETLRVLRQVARGLREAHKLGAVHRDLKPSNIMLVPEEDGGEVVKILDFGIGKLVGDAPGEEQELTQEGAFLGSPKYVAPEMVNERRVDARTDVYSLGVMGYECLTGALPFQTETNLEMILAHCSAPVPEMSRRAPPDVRVPAIVEGFVRRCLEKSPTDRPQSMEEVLRNITECEQSLGIPSLGAVPSVSSSRNALRSEPSSGPTPSRGDSSHDTLSSNVRSELPPSAQAATPAQPRRWLMPLAVAGTTVAICVLAGVVVARRGAPAAEVAAVTSSPEPAPSAATSAAGASSFALVLDSTPQNALVFESDRVLGTTPMQITIDHASVQSAPRRFVLRLDGYAPYTVLQVDSQTPVEVVAPLVPAPTASAAPPPSRPTARPPAARPAATRPENRDTDIKLTR